MKQTTVSQNKFVKEMLRSFEDHFPFLKSKQTAQDLFNTEPFRFIMENAPGVIFITNFHTKEYLYVSPNVEKLLGVAAERFYEEGHPLTLALMPEAHQKVFVEELYPTLLKFCIEHAAKRILKSVRFSFITGLGKEEPKRSYLHQMSILEEDSQGLPWLGLKFLFDVTSIKQDSSVELEIARYNSETHGFEVLEQHSYGQPSETNVLSKRELEIVKRLGEGKSSKEIASEMFLSRYTVDNHRRNIKQKLKATNTHELLQKLSQGRLI